LDIKRPRDADKLQIVYGKMAKFCGLAALNAISRCRMTVNEAKTVKL